jgi:hypothetical protein
MMNNSIKPKKKLKTSIVIKIIIYTIYTSSSITKWYNLPITNPIKKDILTHLTTSYTIYCLLFSFTFY